MTDCQIYTIILDPKGDAKVKSCYLCKSRDLIFFPHTVSLITHVLFYTHEYSLAVIQIKLVIKIYLTEYVVFYEAHCI